MKRTALLAALLTAVSCHHFDPSESITSDPATAPEMKGDASSGEKVDWAPDAKEWATAEKLEITRATRECDVRKSGDLIRLDCLVTETNLMEQLAGDPTRVRFASKMEKQTERNVWHAYVVMPLVKGDKRVIQFAHVAESRWEWGANAEGVASIYWLEEDEKPTILVE